MSLLGGMLGLAVLGSPQGAVAAPPAVPATEEVTVTGRRLREGASEFVRDVAVPTTRGLLARWRSPVCPGVIGFPETYGQFVADRIAQEAFRVDLEVGAPGCTPNLVILVTPDAQATSRDFAEEHGHLLSAYPKQIDLTAGPKDQTLKSFIEGERAVRWWHVTKFATADGRAVSLCEVPTDPQLPAGAAPLVLCQETTGSSRIRSAWSEDLGFVLIVVDTTKLSGASYEQLASYLAMPALAQLAADADSGGLPSILSLFEDRAAGADGEESLTVYDRAYLKALYDAPDGATLRTQRGELRRALIEAGSGGGGDPR